MLRFREPTLRRLRTLFIAFAAMSIVAVPKEAFAQVSQQLPGWEDAEYSPSSQPKPLPSHPTRTSAAGLSPNDAQIAGADLDLERWNVELRQVQRQTRSYLGSWIVGQSALIAVNVYTATTADVEARSTAFTIASALSVANFMYLLVQGWPAIGSHKRFRAMPSSTVQEKVLKATYAQEVISAQRNKDRMATTIERHIGAFVVGIGAGLGVGLGYGDLYEGLGLGIGIIGIAELMMLSRPGSYYSPERRPTFSLRAIRVTPLADRQTRGLGISARF